MENETNFFLIFQKTNIHPVCSNDSDVDGVGFPGIGTYP